MHYKNGRPAKKGDWVVGITHNSQKRIRVGYVKDLMPDKGHCNVKLHVWPGRFDYCESVPDWRSPDQTLGEDDYAYAGELLHVMDGYRVACAIANAYNWDSDFLAMRMDQ